MSYNLLYADNMTSATYPNPNTLATPVPFTDGAWPDEGTRSMDWTPRLSAGWVSQGKRLFADRKGDGKVGLKVVPFSSSGVVATNASWTLAAWQYPVYPTDAGVTWTNPWGGPLNGDTISGTGQRVMPFDEMGVDPWYLQVVSLSGAAWLAVLLDPGDAMVF